MWEKMTRVKDQKGLVRNAVRYRAFSEALAEPDPGEEERPNREYNATPSSICPPLPTRYHKALHIKRKYNQ